MTKIPDDAVERAAKALYEVEFEHLKGYPKPPPQWDETEPGWTEFDRKKRRKMARAALENSGGTFLTDDEKNALKRFMHYQPLAGPDDSAEEWKRQWYLIESVREKLS